MLFTGVYDSSSFRLPNDPALHVLLLSAVPVVSEISAQESCAFHTVIRSHSEMNWR